MNPSLHNKSPCTSHTLLSYSCIHRTMSQEGANLPQEVEGSHDEAIAPHGSIPAGVGSPRAIMMMAGSNSSSVNNLASAADNTGSSSERTSPAVLSTDEDNNAASKIASLAVLRAGEDNNVAPKIASPVLLLAGEVNKVEFKLASPTVLLAGEENGNDAGPKFASSVMLQDCDNSKAESDAGVDNNAAARSKLASPTVLHAGDGNDSGSKIASSVPQAIMDNTATRSKLNNALHADEHNNAKFTLPKPAVHSKDMDNNAGQPRFVSPGSVLLRAGEENKARTKLAIQALPHAGVPARSSRLTRSAAAGLHAAKDNASKLTIQVVPDPYAGKDNNTGSSKAATIPTTVDASASNAKKGKNNVAGEQQLAYEVDVGGGCRKGNTTVAEDVDHNLHIFTERERRKKMKNMFSTLHGLLPQLPDKADKATIVGETVIYIKVLERTLEKLKKLKMERQFAVAAQQQHGQQQQLMVGATGSSRASSSGHPAPALPSPAKLADMVHGLHAQQAAAVAAANNALVTAQAAAATAAGAGGSSSATGSGVQLPRGTVPFPVPAAGFQTWTGHNVAVSVANNEAYINLHCPRELGTLTKALFVLERNHIEVVTTTVSTQDSFRMYGIHARVNPASASARFPENLCAEDRFKLAVSEMVQMINNV